MLHSEPRIDPAIVDDMAMIINSGEGRRKGKYGRYVLRAMLEYMRNDTEGYYATSTASITEIARFFPGKPKRETVSKAVNDALATGALIRLKKGKKGYSSTYTFSFYAWDHDTDIEAEQLAEAAHNVPRSECGSGDVENNVENSDNVPRSQCGEGDVNNSASEGLNVPRSGSQCPPFDASMSPVQGLNVPRSECGKGGTSLHSYTFYNPLRGVFDANASVESEAEPQPRADPAAPSYEQWVTRIAAKGYDPSLKNEYDRLYAARWKDARGEPIKDWKAYLDRMGGGTAKPEHVRKVVACPVCGQKCTAQIDPRTGLLTAKCTGYEHEKQGVSVYTFTVDG